MSTYLTHPSQGAAERLSAVASLAQDPAGPGPRGLSELAATCYLPPNALTRETETVLTVYL